MVLANVLDRFRLTDKVAIVTGASRGIGRAYAEALAEAGAHVLLAARTTGELEALARSLTRGRRRALAVATDVSREADLDALVARAVGEFGRIDILVNNVGTTARYPAEEFPIAEWDRVMDVNLRSIFLLSQKVAPVMKGQGGGKIINTASLCSEIGVPLTAAYSAAKGGLRQLTKVLAVEWARFGITVNAIGPGYIRTEMTEPLFRNAKRYRAVLDRVALGRWGTPDDLKGALLFLASSASDYVTGQVLYVDGGWLAQ
jgi:NAD(P)-dependent dehydrogenase (short-subunit alcohol dehydrogenase family)